MRVMQSVFGALKRQTSDLGVRRLYLDELDQKLKREAASAPHKIDRMELDHPLAATFLPLLCIVLKEYQSSVSRLARNENELCPGGETLIKN